MEEIQKQELTSMDIKEAQLLKLKELFPEAFTEGLKVDWDKLRLSLGDDTVDTGKERYGMNWPGKADCFKTIQQPSIATLVPARDESIDFDTTQNLFIEGDNLEVLKLLQKSYLGKIKMIYIDPPYNTGKDFIYPDNFSETLFTYLEYTGQIDGEGKKFSTNTETSGRFHSNWMNMMYPRLFLAKNLLKDNGVIYISIDDNEISNLKSLCNEIFGEECFLGCISVISNLKGRSDDKYFASAHNYLLAYAKGSFITKGIPLPETYWDDYPEIDTNGKRFRLLGLRKRGSNSRREDRPNMYYPIYVNPTDLSISIERNNDFSEEILPHLSDGTDGCWRWGKKTTDINSESLIAKQVGPENRWDVFQMDFAENEEGLKRIKPKSFWIGPEFSNEAGTLETKKLLGKKIFDTPKPTGLIISLLEQAVEKDEIILDFFAGSATTAHAVLELNKEDSGTRKFICVQIPEQTDEKSEAYKAGYKTIADISKERIRRVIAKINKEEIENIAYASGKLFEEKKENRNDLGFKVYKLQKSNLKIWDTTLEKEPEEIQQRLFEHIQHISPEAQQEAILYELLLKSGFELTTPIEALTLAGKTVFSIADGQLLICLEKEITHDCIKAMAEKEPSRVICLDEAFTGTNADALKTNAVQIMKSKGVVNFRTV